MKKNSGKVTVTEPYMDMLTKALELHKAGDHAGAMEIYKEASEKGSQLAKFNLGNCYFISSRIISILYFWLFLLNKNC